MGKSYKCVEIDTGIFWPVESLEYIDEDITLITDSSQYNFNSAQASRKEYGNSGAFYYTQAARVIINSKKTSSMKNITNVLLDKLMSYILNKVRAWKGESIELDSENLSTLVKNSQFATYENWINLLDIGVDINGFNQNGTFGYIPFGYSKPVFFGLTTSNTNFGEMIRLYNGKKLEYFSSDLGQTCYQMRYFIDEN
jgi:hypothetical protein